MRLPVLLWGWLAASAVAAPAVEAIFPSGDALPANHLKFYLHFSEPMRQGVFLLHCRLLDERGKEVPEPFRETELWSDDARRLTLWLHPGRQKTGVNLNVELGPVLDPHRRYTLVISGKWPSDAGAPLGAEVRKTFRTLERATQQLDTAAWQISPPRVGTTKPLSLRFLAPLDHALLLRCLRVENVEGRIATEDHERVWTFTPAHPWTSGSHRVLVESKLEDLAGNSLARPFEVDLDAAPPPARPPVLAIPFQPVN